MYSIAELKQMGVILKGTNIKISKFVNIYNPTNLTLHDNIRIDDFTVLSCKGKIEIHEYVRISSHCLLSSEKNIIINKYCNLSSGVKIYGGIDNIDNCITNPLIPNKYSSMDIGNVIIQKHSIIGANSIIYPNFNLSEGISVRPLSVVNVDTEPWKIYQGNPIKIIKDRKITNKNITDIDNEIFFDKLYTDDLELKIDNITDETINIDNKSFKKLNILITGGSKGIGKNIAINFLNEGHNVIITYKNSYKDALEMKNMGIFIYQLDVIKNDECKKVLQNIINDFTKIDVLINNAGILKNELFHKMSYEKWHDVINTNLISIYNITHPIINNMLEYNDGKIINISSIYGLKGSKGQSNYCASKFGIIGFTKTLALEYGRKNILTNCICPGMVNTDMIKEINNKIVDKVLDTIPVNKLIEPDEIFNICKLLINSTNCNGSVFNIDGGMFS